MTNTHSKTFCLWLINWLKQDQDHESDFCFLDKPEFFSSLNTFIHALSERCFQHLEAAHVFYAAILLKRWLPYLIKSSPTSFISPEQLATYFGLCLWISHALCADDVYTAHVWMTFFHQDLRFFANLHPSVYPEIDSLVKKRDRLLHQLWQNNLLMYTQDYAPQPPPKEDASFYHAYQTLLGAHRIQIESHRRFKKTIKTIAYISLILISFGAIGLSIFWSHPLVFAFGVTSLVCFSGLLAETAFFHVNPQQR